MESACHVTCKKEIVQGIWLFFENNPLMDELADAPTIYAGNAHKYVTSLCVYM